MQQRALRGARVVVVTAATAGSLFGCAHAPASAPPRAPPPKLDVAPTVLSPRTEGTPDELYARGEAAVAEHLWTEAIDAFEALIAAEPGAPRTPSALLDLGAAYEGRGEKDDRTRAQAAYHRLATQFPAVPSARTALARATAIHAYLEEWPRLRATADELLARKDLDDVDRMTALGARGLAEVEAGELDRGARDIEEGLDVMERTRYGALNRLPVPAAQLRFAEGELRRARSEKIALTAASGKADGTFLALMDARCTLLMSAQSAYADAIRSVDPHWAAMSGVRVGEMYRVLHGELMSIPPVDAAKTERQKQLHFGMMHVRYRVLLEKGIEMMRRTLELGAKLESTSGSSDESPWIARAIHAKAEMEGALTEEKGAIAKLPFNEEELEAALEKLRQKTEASPR